MVMDRGHCQILVIIWFIQLNIGKNGQLDARRQNMTPATSDFQQCGMYYQQRLRSACAYAQSDQSLC